MIKQGVHTYFSHVFSKSEIVFLLSFNSFNIWYCIQSIDQQYKKHTVDLSSRVLREKYEPSLNDSVTMHIFEHFHRYSFLTEAYIQSRISSLHSEHTKLFLINDLNAIYSIPQSYSFQILFAMTSM